MHLIEETARHNGHIDILREMADGADRTMSQDCSPTEHAGRIDPAADRLT